MRHPLPPHIAVSFMHIVREEKVKATATRAWRRNNEEEISLYKPCLPPIIKTHVANHFSRWLFVLKIKNNCCSSNKMN